MSLLSDDDKALLVLEHLGPAALAGDTMSLYDCFQLALDVAEKAVLAKLASAELPAATCQRKGDFFDVDAPTEYEQSLGWEPLYTADQLRQAYAQGAAAQLAEKPSAKQFQTPDGKWHPFLDLQHEEHTVNDGRWPIRELYTRREA